MAKVFIEESTLTSIGDAIRDKTATTELIGPTAMPAAIRSIVTSSSLPEGALVLSGNCSHAFASPIWDWYLYLDGVTTSNITEAVGMFSDWDRTDKDIPGVPFDINIVDGCDCSQMFQYVDDIDVPNINGAIGDAKNMFDQARGINAIPALTFDNSEAHNYSSMFDASNNIKTMGTFTNIRPSHMSRMFALVTYLPELPQFVNLDTSDLRYCSGMFYGCHSLRSIPEDLLKRLYCSVSNGYQHNSILSNSFNECYALDEIRGLNPQTGTASISNNLFSSTFNSCYRLKDIIFATQENGTAYSVSWKSQTIDLSKYVGYGENTSFISNYQSGHGITLDKQVTDATDYDILKNDPDWWTINSAYSRYNHDSAVNTINSLPDTSAYLTANGGTNTIKFKGESGSDTDGGAINTLTAEEIAVAAAKGWTVTLS